MEIIIFEFPSLFNSQFNCHAYRRHRGIFIFHNNKNKQIEILRSLDLSSKMGSPELPPDDDDANMYRDTSGSSTVTFPQNYQANTASEESDNNTGTEADSFAAGAGYQQLSFNGDLYSGIDTTTDDDDDEEEVNDIASTPDQQHFPGDMHEIDCATGSNAFPDVVPVDVEVAQAVWNAPRPTELNTIVMDEQRSTQIMNIMSGFNLPATATPPPWTQAVSEDQWKSDLLAKIRQNK